MKHAKIRGVIYVRFNELKKKKSEEDKQSISLRDIATETGIALSTLHRLSTGKTEGLRLATIDSLCAYFCVADAGELIEYRTN